MWLCRWFSNYDTEKYLQVLQMCLLNVWAKSSLIYQNELLFYRIPLKCRLTLFCCFFCAPLILKFLCDQIWFSINNLFLFYPTFYLLPRFSECYFRSILYSFLILVKYFFRFHVLMFWHYQFSDLNFLLMILPHLLWYYSPCCFFL